MENFSVPMVCSECKVQLKRQVIDSNVFYYCRSCGRMSSEVCFSGESGMTHAQKPLAAQRVSSVTELEVSENARNAMVET
ncbi:hypothetical protein EO95_01505 [Methanosarcina sp. 1.H.T.1A.1]|uniref:hypothetical protein n=1 Tax=unclassified Methanosarcina TaxID=2644672 RepID=UPI000621B6F7|nr:MULTISPECIES: hypothetical protein [unclassified Methanosarcina]KKH46241.1 hypothetical protein EO93_10740 [Methanosarcina sp. 1.H.A.2.2]KKH96669.1 hypothetical protein EO95_01505 [Methanosarcina sp. 1.H.T.1A.1]